MNRSTFGHEIISFILGFCVDCLMAHNKKSRTKHDVCREQFRVRLSDPQSASGAGLTVFTRYELDTELGTLLSEFGNVFEMWRLHRIVVHFVPILGSTAVGWVGLTYLPDPMDTTPASAASALSAQYAIAKPLADISGFSFSVPALDRRGWLYTKDIVVESDRWEAFGDLVFLSSATSSGTVPGILYAVLDVSFRNPINSGIGAIRSMVDVDATKKQQEAKVGTQSQSQVPPAYRHRLLGR